MKGANEYCKLFDKAEQIGRLYVLPSSHARGDTFRVYVLPKGEQVIENGGSNPPLNENAVEVYGVISGHRGWTEVYDWLHVGKWRQDFEEIVVQRKYKESDRIKQLARDKEETDRAKGKVIDNLLGSY